MNDFSYQHYRKIIAVLVKTGKLTTFRAVNRKQPNQYIVIRHDIEFSVDRALNLAKLEKKLGIHTTYLVQIRNPIYNPFSHDNLQCLRMIKNLGHEIGLHYYCIKERPFNQSIAAKEIKVDLQVLSYMLGFKVDIFSIHRPNENILKAYLNIPGIINCYGKKFFHFYPKKFPAIPLNQLPAVYLADSNNQWYYGEPLVVLKQLSQVKMQILFHPYSWNKNNWNDQINLKQLFHQKIIALNRQFHSELKNFPTFSEN